MRSSARSSSRAEHSHSPARNQAPKPSGTWNFSRRLISSPLSWRGCTHQSSNCSLNGKKRLYRCSVVTVKLFNGSLPKLRNEYQNKIRSQDDNKSLCDSTASLGRFKPGSLDFNRLGEFYAKETEIRCCRERGGGGNSVYTDESASARARPSLRQLPRGGKKAHRS